MRKTFGRKRGETAGEKRRINKENLQTVIFPIHYSSDSIKKNRIGGICGTYGRRRATYRVLVGKPERKRQLGILRSGWQSNVNSDFQEVDGGWELTGFI
jgi:hypothetical protein